jgi:hypothetical protein
MDDRAELAELVDDHLSRGKNDDFALAAIASGLAKVLEAIGDAQASRGNWGAMMSNLRLGRAELEVGLASGAELGPLRDYAQRQAAFAALLVSEIERLQAGETTLV